MNSLRDSLDHMTRKELFHRLRDEVLQKTDEEAAAALTPSALERAEAVFVGALEAAVSRGAMIVAGTFGSPPLSADPMTALSMHHEAYLGAGTEIWICCHILGWRRDQAWAFLAGFDLDPNPEKTKFVDPRVEGWRPLYNLGRRLRSLYIEKRL